MGAGAGVGATPMRPVSAWIWDMAISGSGICRKDAPAVSGSAAGVSAPAADGTLVSATAQYFGPGWCDTGSASSAVTAFTAASSAKTSAQWKGVKQEPGITRSVTLAGSTAAPRRERISTRSLSRIPSRPASSGWISTKGAGFSLFRAGIFPVLVIVCHWCGRRPVLNAKGKSSSGSSGAGRQGRARKRARPLGVGKAMRGTAPSGAVNSVWLTPSLR